MVKDQLEKDLKKAVIKLGFKPGDIVCGISENEHFGDYTSNVALQLANQKVEKSYQSPREIANGILEELDLPSYLESIEVAGPGFINFFISDKVLVEDLKKPLDKFSHKESFKYLIEYGQPNTHKEIHIGHLRTLFIGESISRILDFLGHQIYRVSYGSDIGPTVAKALWGIGKLDSEYQQVKEKGLREKAEFLGKAYTFGHKNYEDNPQAKEEIDGLTVRLYSRDPEIMEIWDETRNWSLGYFKELFSRLGTKFDHILIESEVEEAGKKEVLANVGQVFVESEGAIIFPGEKYGLHNRVFITSAGYPTYEGKEIGLTRKEQALFPFDESIHVVDVRQAGFFQVVNKSLELLDESMKGRKRHLPYGYLSLSTGAMSSRKGNIISAGQFVDRIREEIFEKYPQNSSLESKTLEKIALAAIKFYYLKYSLTTDIVFDIDKAISLQGDTGPYLLYAYTRIQSILKKAGFTGVSPSTEFKTTPKIELAERQLLRQVEFFDYHIEEAQAKFSPNLIAEYLLEIAKLFNAYYEKNQIIGSKSEVFKLLLINKIAGVLEKGLYLLGIETVEKM
jgi:arginyl-tRNA synthetase